MTFQRIIEMAIKPPFKYYVVRDGYFGNAVADKFCFNSLSKAKECAEQLFLETKEFYSIYGINMVEMIGIQEVDGCAVVFFLSM